MDSESSEDSSSEDEVYPAHQHIVKSYEQVDQNRRSRQQQQGTTQQLSNVSGKGAEIFQKRQQRMTNYISDGENLIG